MTGSTISSPSAAITSPPASIAPPEPRPSRPGPRSPAWPLGHRRSIGVRVAGLACLLATTADQVDGAEEPPDLAPDLRNALHVRWDEIRAELLPDAASTDSLDLLAQLGVELIFINAEDRAAQEVERICASATMLGIDLETAPR